MASTTNLEIEKLNSGTAENANFGIYVCGKTN